MPTRIGLMGLGRIGRNLFRLLYENRDLEIAAVSDIADPAALAYLLQFDTILGRFPAHVGYESGQLAIGERRVPIVQGTRPGEVDWAAYGVDTVIEATSRPRTRAELSLHFERGAKRLILCSRPADPPDVTVVPGVNDGDLQAAHRIVSNASSTAHAVAPVLKILGEQFGIARAFVTSVHAYTNQQRLADVPAPDGRSGRAAAQNIIPQPTNVAEVIERVLPALAGKLTGLAINVPVANGSAVDLVCWHERPVTVAEINRVIEEAAAGALRGVLDFERSPIVSSDILRSSASGTFDSLATMVLQGRVSKTLSWFDNGWGYAHRVVGLLGRFAELDRRQGEAAP